MIKWNNGIGTRKRTFEKCFGLGTISFYKACAFKLTYHESLKDKTLKCSHLHHKQLSLQSVQLKNNLQQEGISVGCVPPAAVTISGECTSPGWHPPGRHPSTPHPSCTSHPGLHHTPLHTTPTPPLNHNPSPLWTVWQTRLKHYLVRYFICRW